MNTMQFTRQNVLDAYCASRIDQEAEERDCTPRQVIRDLAQDLGLNGQFTMAKAAQYQQGRQILYLAMLISSEPLRPATQAATQAREGIADATTGEVVEVAAMQEGMVQYVGLAGNGHWR